MKADSLRDKRVPIMFSSEELEMIDTWRFANRIATRSEAVRRLVTTGMVQKIKEMQESRGSRAAH
ncbi:hypothetical protein [Ensifer sp. SL37]|uniref:hypothetical protein n=1 Tax=Ensifer sp. SL37 TaxID=2995137 RepID=UPI0022749651|nr:hypothetical protein [Ensifer sp. SL37]MCY1741170.1 hypothetical protein [Ensifer sp. SL37]